MLPIFLLFLTVSRSLAALVYDCHTGWETLDQKCYKFIFLKLVLAEAKAKCHENGATLLSVNSDKENKFIINYLATHDVQRQTWYTSGVVNSTTTNSYFWEGDGTLVKQYQFWINEDAKKKKGDRVIYEYASGAYGWSLGVSTKLRASICEIDRADSYRIKDTTRDLSYGLAVYNPNNIPRGPKIKQEPINTIVIASTKMSYIECIADANPSPSYEWFSNMTKITSLTDTRYTTTNGRLSIANFKEGVDDAYYTCMVSNKFGKVRSKSIQMSVGLLGEFTNVKPSRVKAQAFQGATIQCTTPAFKPAIRFQWFKNYPNNFVRPKLQKHVFISMNGKLFFSEVSTDDEGEYYCVISLASDSTSMFFGSQQLPSRTSLGITLEVENRGTGNVDPLILNEFPAVFPGKPLVGQTIRIECFAYGTGPLIYSWFRNGTSLPARAKFSDNNRVITIQNVAIEDGGEYICEVKSSTVYQSHRRSHVFTIQAAPFLVFPLKDMIVDAESEMTWRCEANADPKPVYTWYKNAAILQEESGRIQINQNVLTIQRLDANKDNGMYQCKASNKYGMAFSAGQLKVVSVKPTFEKHPLSEKVLAAESGNVTLMCKPEAAPAPVVKWLKDGRDLGLSKGSTKRIRMLYNGYLFISEVNNRDAGTYTCVVKNNLGSASNKTMIEIVGRTSLIRKPDNISVQVNETAFLACSASHPKILDVVYIWKFNGHQIDFEKETEYIQKKGDSPDSSTGGLYVRTANFKHEGWFECTAKTVVNLVKAKAFLKVLGPPSEPGGLIREINSVKFSHLDDRSLRFRWFSGNDHGSPINYYIFEYMDSFNKEWRYLMKDFRDRDTLVQDERMRMAEIHGLSPGTNYKFRVYAKNIYGLGLPSKPTGWIHIPGDAPTKAPDEVGGGGGKVGMLKITWKILPPEDQNGDGIGYIVYWRSKRVQGISLSEFQKKVLKGNVSQHLVTLGQGKYYNEYEVQVQAFNKYGRGPKSTISQIYSAEDLPNGTPTRVAAVGYNSTAISVSWKPVPDDRKNMKGKLLGYKINYWLRYEEDENQAIQAIVGGQKSETLIIGLLTNTYYKINIQAFNSAGNGPKSETYPQKPFHFAPKYYPTEVEVFSFGENACKVMFRGVTTGTDEEPLQGYKIRYWLETDNIRNAKDVDLKKNEEGIIRNLEKTSVYKLRVLAYSRGGDGKMSSPITRFTVLENGNIRSDMIDLTKASILAGSENLAPTLCLLLMSFITRWLC